MNRTKRTFLAEALMCVVAGGAIAAYAFWPQTPLRLVTQVYPPFQYVDQSTGTVMGSSVATIRCALGNTPYELEVVQGKDWHAAQKRVEAGELDAFFGALRTDKRDSYAVWSVPIDSHTAYFVRRRDNDIDRTSSTARWGVKKGSGIQAQVRELTKNVTYEGDDNPDVVKALLDGLVDYVYMDYRVFQWSVRENGVQDWDLENMIPLGTSFESELFHLSPAGEQQLYGMYVSRTWLRSNPRFMDRFNTAVSRCRQQREFQ